MRNFLNTTFKFLSRSLGVAFCIILISQCTYGQLKPEFLEFKSTKTQVAVGEGWVITGSSKNAAGCLVQASDKYGDGIYTPNSFRLEKLSDGDVQEITYTATCYGEISRKFCNNLNVCTVITSTSSTPYTGNYEFPSGQVLEGVYIFKDPSETKSITIKVIDVEGQNPCSDDPSSSACKLCGPGNITDEDSPQCRTCSSAADPNEEPACACADNPSGLLCKATSQEELEVASGLDVKPPEECSITSLSGWGQCAVNAALVIVKSTIVSLAASFLQLCAYIFEFSIQISIVQFSNLITVGEVDWLTNIWGIVRDILNIGVIFVLLYAAINVIVGRGGEIKKLIAGVILFGVMTNFSLFLTKAALDITNVIALEFYQQMRTLPLSESGWSGGLGASVVTITGLTNFYDPNPLEGDAELKPADNILKDSFLYLFSMSFVFIAVGFVFLQAAGLFIARTISVILLLIFSPLMFAGAIFSPLQKWIDQWHKEFIGQITVAPIFMILLYVILTILGSLITSVNDSLKENVDMFSFLSLILLTSALTIFGFSAALTQAKKYAGTIGGKGAQLFAKAGSSVATFGFNQTAGRAASFALNQTAGYAAKGAQWATQKIPVLKDFSYDVRNTKTAQNVGAAINGGVSKALSAATGGAITGIQVNAGTGFKKREDRLKEEKEGIQKKADAKIEDEFKKIDEKTKKYDLTDAKIIDAAGAELVRTNEDDSAWKDKVKIANSTSKKLAQDKKTTYLATLTTDSRSTTEKGKAAFRAKKAAEEKMEKGAKEKRDNDKHREDLKKYTSVLVNKLASDAGARLDPPLDTVILSVPKADIEKMSKEELIAQWNTVQDKIQRISDTYVATNKTILKDPTHPQYAAVYDKKQSIGKELKMASGARADITSLSKKIDDYDKK